LDVTDVIVCDSWRNDSDVILADEIGLGLGRTVESVSMLGFLQLQPSIV